MFTNFSIKENKFTRNYVKEVTIKVPPMGDSITEGTIQQWVKTENSPIKEDDVICKIDTDKVTVDIRAPEKGTFLKQLAKSGETVFIGQDLYKYSDEVKEGASAQTETKKAETKPQTPSTPVQKEAPKTEAPKEVPKVVQKPQEQTQQTQTINVAPSGGERRVKMTRMRQTIAQRLKDSQNQYAMLTTFNEVDMSNLQELRNQYKDSFLKKHGVKLGFMSAFVKASAYALMEIPAVNAVIDGSDIVYHDYVDISVAVATPKGLVVPVIRNCQDLTFAQIEKEIGNLGEKAKKNEITLQDMQGGTFTISNGGVFGSMMGTPIVNPPQSAILGMHAIKNRAVVVDDKIVIRPMMYLALTYDHRLIDGREAVTFLVKVKELIENPNAMLLE